MEYWNDGILEGWSLKIHHSLMNAFYFPVKRDVVNIPLPHFPRTHYSIIPVFQHSNCKRSELTCLFNLCPSKNNSFSTLKGLYPKLFQTKTEDVSWKTESLFGKDLFRGPERIATPYSVEDLALKPHLLLHADFNRRFQDVSHMHVGELFTVTWG